jgi:hypothetical protein
MTELQSKATQIQYNLNDTYCSELQSKATQIQYNLNDTYCSELQSKATQIQYNLNDTYCSELQSKATQLQYDLKAAELLRAAAREAVSAFQNENQELRIEAKQHQLLMAPGEKDTQQGPRTSK